jgi:hypothetical protein
VATCEDTQLREGKDKDDVADARSQQPQKAAGAGAGGAGAAFRGLLAPCVLLLEASCATWRSASARGEQRAAAMPGNEDAPLPPPRFEGSVFALATLRNMLLEVTPFCLSLPHCCRCCASAATT